MNALIAQVGGVLVVVSASVDEVLQKLIILSYAQEENIKTNII